MRQVHGHQTEAAGSTRDQTNLKADDDIINIRSRYFGKTIWLDMIGDSNQVRITSLLEKVYVNKKCCHQIWTAAQLTITFLKLTTETLEQGVKYIQS